MEFDCILVIISIVNILLQILSHSLSLLLPFSGSQFYFQITKSNIIVQFSIIAGVIGLMQY